MKLTMQSSLVAEPQQQLEQTKVICEQHKRQTDADREQQPAVDIVPQQQQRIVQTLFNGGPHLAREAKFVADWQQQQWQLPEHLLQQSIQHEQLPQQLPEQITHSQQHEQQQHHYQQEQRGKQQQQDHRDPQQHDHRQQGQPPGLDAQPHADHTSTLELLKAGSTPCSLQATSLLSAAAAAGSHSSAVCRQHEYVSQDGCVQEGVAAEERQLGVEGCKVCRQRMACGRCSWQRSATIRMCARSWRNNANVKPRIWPQKAGHCLAGYSLKSWHPWLMSASATGLLQAWRYCNQPLPSRHTSSSLASGCPHSCYFWLLLQQSVWLKPPWPCMLLLGMVISFLRSTAFCPSHHTFLLSLLLLSHKQHLPSQQALANEQMDCSFEHCMSTVSKRNNACQRACTTDKSKSDAAAVDYSTAAHAAFILRNEGCYSRAGLAMVSLRCPVLQALTCSRSFAAHQYACVSGLLLLHRNRKQTL